MAPAVEIESLAKNYGDKAAVRDVSLRVEQGETFGYLGPNGAGKTTTIRCMLGLLKPTRGAIRILGKDVATQRLSILERVGYVPGEFSLWPQLTGRDCLDYLGRLQTAPPSRRSELCNTLELGEEDLDRQVRFYSRGMRQKIALVQAFQHGPQLVVMDEPTEGLDPLMKERVLHLLHDHAEKGGTVFLSSHILSEVQESADRVAVIKDGIIVKESATAELTAERELHCTVRLKKPPPSSFTLEIPGVGNLREDTLNYTFDFRGDMEPLVKMLAKAHVEEFLAEPETLLEAFMEVYGGVAQR